MITLLFTTKQSVLSYSARTAHGYGELLCFGINSIGRQEQPCRYQVVAGRVPDKLSDCIIGNQSTSSLLIKCDAGNDGGLPQTFFLEVYRSGNGQLYQKLNSSHRPLFEVNDLPRSATFVLILYAANSKGKSDSTTFIASTLPFPNKGTFSFQTISFKNKTIKIIRFESLTKLIETINLFFFFFAYTELVTLTPLIAILLAVVGSLVFTACSIMVIAKYCGFDPDKGESKVNQANQTISLFNLKI